MISNLEPARQLITIEVWRLSRPTVTPKARSNAIDDPLNKEKQYLRQHIIPWPQCSFSLNHNAHAALSMYQCSRTASERSLAGSTSITLFKDHPPLNWTLRWNQISWDKVTIDPSIINLAGSIKPVNMRSCFVTSRTKCQLIDVQSAWDGYWCDLGNEAGSEEGNYRPIKNLPLWPHWSSLLQLMCPHAVGLSNHWESFALWTRGHGHSGRDKHHPKLHTLAHICQAVNESRRCILLCWLFLASTIICTWARMWQAAPEALAA